MKTSLFVGFSLVAMTVAAFQLLAPMSAERLGIPAIFATDEARPDGGRPDGGSDAAATTATAEAGRQDEMVQSQSVDAPADDRSAQQVRVILPSPYGQRGIIETAPAQSSERVATAAEEESPDAKAERRRAARELGRTPPRSRIVAGSVDPSSGAKTAEARASAHADAHASGTTSDPIIESSDRSRSGARPSGGHSSETTDAKAREALDQQATASIAPAEQAETSSPARLDMSRASRRAERRQRDRGLASEARASREQRRASRLARQRDREPQVGDLVDPRLLDNAPLVTRREVAEQGRRQPRVGDLVDPRLLREARPIVMRDRFSFVGE